MATATARLECLIDFEGKDFIGLFSFAVMAFPSQREQDAPAASYPKGKGGRVAAAFPQH
jgi:hypothetical protein